MQLRERRRLRFSDGLRAAAAARGVTTGRSLAYIGAGRAHAALERAQSALRETQDESATARAAAKSEAEGARSRGQMDSRVMVEAYLRAQSDASWELLVAKHAASSARVAADDAAQHLRAASAAAEGQIELLQRDLTRGKSEVEAAARSGGRRVETLEAQLARALRKLAQR